MGDVGQGIQSWSYAESSHFLKAHRLHFQIICSIWVFSTFRYLFRRSTSKLKVIGPIVMLRKYNIHRPNQSKIWKHRENRTIFRGVEDIKGYSED